MSQIPFTLIRSKRRTLSLQITKEWKLIARAPLRMFESTIEAFIESKIDWIKKHQEKIAKRGSKKEIKSYTPEEIREMKERLKHTIIPRTRELWEGKNLPKYTSIKITKSERRWWSCSAKNWLCFSYRLAEYIDQNSLFIDAIIIHELAHLREKHHQKSFWNLVYSMMPTYEDIMKDTQSFD